MKKLFKKAVTVLGSATLIGATVAMAAAANYPQPFTSNSAVVVGANAPADNVAAGDIINNLNANAVSNGTTTIRTDGDSYEFQKSSTKLHLGDDLTSIKSTLDEDEMPVLLNDGVYTDSNNNDFDFSQSITMSSSSLSMFDDSDYSRDDPTIGFRYASGSSVLSYTLDFTDEPAIADMDTSDLTIMGKDYYVLETSNTASGTTITLLDSAASSVVAEKEPQTITSNGTSYTVATEWVGETSAKLNVNGEITNDLSEGETYKLNDGSYLGVKDIMYSAKDSGVSRVEYSIGSGKIILGDNGDEVEMNDDNINGLTSTIVNNSDALTSITIAWDTDDDGFVTKDSVLTMPGFKTVSLSYTGLDYPAEEEMMVSNDGDDSIILKNFPLKDSTEDINILYKASGSTQFEGIGKDNDERLLTGATNITFDGDEDAYFVASYDDGSNPASYLMRASNFKTEDNIDKVTFQYSKDGSWISAKTDRKAGDTFSVGDVELEVGAVNKTAKTVNFWADNSNTRFDTLYSNEGLKVYLPVEGSSTSPAINFTATSTDYKIQMVEEDKDANTASGSTINVTVVADSATDKASVDTVTSDSGFSEIDSSDVYRGFVYSALATELLWDKSNSDQKTLKLIYHGDEVKASAYITSADAVSSSSVNAGVMSVKDSEVATVAGKNLVVIGGSAINSVAAELLGGAYSECDFTSATGVAAGEFLIQTFKRSSGETALLVAGYNADDTEKAATYLLNHDVDTTVGTRMKGTSATGEAVIVTA